MRECQKTITVLHHEHYTVQGYLIAKQRRILKGTHNFFLGLTSPILTPKSQRLMSWQIFIGHNTQVSCKLFFLGSMTGCLAQSSPVKTSHLWCIHSRPKLRCDDGPFLLAHKKATSNRLKSGAERISVSIDIYNQGSATAYDVSLTDDSWSQEYFDIISGNTSTSWERLDVGALLSHSFELESKVKTIFYGAPAVIKFRVPTKASLQEAYSTPLLPLDLLADRPPEKKFDWAKRLLGKYGSLISVISIVVLFIYLLATPSKSAAKGGKKKR